MNLIPDMSPKLKARLTGGFYLLNLSTAVYSQGFVTTKLIVAGDSGATAANIVSHETVFQLAFASYLVEMICQIIVTALFYDLLKPVSRSLSLLAAFISLSGCVVKTTSRLFFITPLLFLGGTGHHYLDSFNQGQIQTLMLMFLEINDKGAGMALVFFGFYAPIKGYLILRSTFLPRFLGVLGIVGGLGWISFLYPPLAESLGPVILPLGLLAALAQVFWLLTFGLNEQRWKEVAAAESSSIWR